jgi:hypothetical protein
MSGLTDIADNAKKIAIGIVLLIIVIIVFKFLFSFIYTVLFTHKTIVPKMPPPNVKFGKLPKPEFTGQTTTNGMQFTLENIDGKPPETTAAAQIFSMPKRSSTLLASDRAKKFASGLGFYAAPHILTSANYEFIDPNDAHRKLALDIINMNFKITYDYLSAGQAFFDKSRPMTKNQTQAAVVGFLKDRGLYDPSFFNPRMSMKNLVYNAATQSFDIASSLSTANAVRVDFFRTDIAGLKVLPPGFDQSYNYAIYTYQQSVNLSFLNINYTFWPVTHTDYATYPLISAKQAWQAVQDGNAVVVRQGQNDPNHIVVRNISLAYFDSEEPQSYLQPIFVFEGDNGFVAYYPAISAEWYIE